MFRLDWALHRHGVRLSMGNEWHFHLQGRGAWTVQGDRGALRMSLSAILNPTRFLSQQPDPTLEGIRALDPIDALYRRDEVSSDARSLTIDGSDNVLLGPAYTGGTSFSEARRVWWSGVLDSYLGHLQTAMRERFSAGGLAQVRQLEIGGLSAAEVYWELELPDAVSWAAEFQAAAIRCHHAAEGWSQNPTAQSGQLNARWLRIPLPGGVTMKVYAKLDRRVRVEIAFSEHLGQLSRRAGAASSSAGDRLAALTDQAHRRVVRAYSEIVRRMEPTPPMADLCDFLASFNSAVPEENRSKLLRLLLNHRHVTAAPGVPLSVCRALERAGILRRVRVALRDKPQFDLTPSYEALARNLVETTAEEV